MRTVPLGELGEIVSGATPKTHVPGYWNGEIPWVTPADLSDSEGIRYHGKPKRITKAGFESCSTVMLPPGSILFSSRAPIGHCALTSFPVCTNQGFKNIIPNGRLNPVYGYFALKFVTPSIIAKGRGATFAEVNKEMMEEVQIPYCELSEQQRIAGVLEQADRLCRTRRYALELSDTFLPAAFQEFFGDPRTNRWSFPVRAAGELFHIELGKMLDAKRITGKYLKPYLGNANVQWGRFELANLKVMDFPPEEFERFKLLPGDILVCEGGEVGRTAIWGGEVADCCYQKALHRLRRKTDEILPDYFQYFMRSAVDTGLVGRHTATATIAHFTAEKFEEFPVMLPPPRKQQQFALLMERHERLRASHREALRQAEHLFQSLLHLAFTTGL